MTFPFLMEGRVVAVDVPNRRLVMDFPSAQLTGIGCKMLYTGPADAMRVSHKAMPGRGTWGLVAFPYGNAINGIWLGAHYPSFLDALSTNTDPFMDYDAHWSGAYEVMDKDGKWTKSFPDGTYIQSSDSTAKPTMYRHTVDSQQNQNLVEFKDTDRVPNPPSARHLFTHHASGTEIDIDPTGNVTITGATGATSTVTFGKATLVVDKNGNIYATAAGGSQVQLTANQGTLTVDQNGGIYGNAAPGQKVRLASGGSATTYTLVRTDLLVAAFNAHTHPDAQGGVTGTPTAPISDGTVQSIIANVSE